MAIALKRTGALGATSVKFLGYGPAGVGKTRAIATLPNPITLSAEAGLLSVKDFDLPYLEIASLADLQEAYVWLTESDEAKGFESVALDSITEIAEVVLSIEKARTVDGKKIHGMKAYGEMADKMADILRAFRDLPNRHVYFSAQMEKSADEQGGIAYAPAMPGNKFAQKVPYFFDEIFAFRKEAGEFALMTSSDGIWSAKDRSGKLDLWEPPDLGAIIRKISGVPHE
jgi:hypothetical protein